MATENIITITHELLKSWSPCPDGYRKFCELFPDGADLKTAADGLSAAGHEEWAAWLFDKCREEKLFEEITIRGHRNTGYRNTGDWNTGDWNTGYRNTGHQNTGDWNTGFFNTITPDAVLAFNKPTSKQKWEAVYKPSFLRFDLTYWVPESEMTDADKAADPNFYMRGGPTAEKRLQAGVQGIVGQRG